MKEISLQQQFGPNGTCFGCGVKNTKGLQIASYWEDEECILKFTPSEEHQAFPGAINGGIIGALFDCHSNWCAAYSLYRLNNNEEFPSTVTSEFHVKLKRPTPFGQELLVKARAVDIEENKVKIEAEMLVDDKITATCTGVFVAVPKGHPAYHRWQ